MATVNKLSGFRPDPGGIIFTNDGGTGLANGDQSTAIDRLNARPEMTWQVTGTFGVGGSVQMEKSNDGSNWVIAGTAVTVASVVEVTTAARFVRFNVTAGDGTTSLFVTLALSEQRG